MIMNLKMFGKSYLWEDNIFANRTEIRREEKCNFEKGEKKILQNCKSKERRCLHMKVRKHINRDVLRLFSLVIIRCKTF